MRTLLKFGLVTVLGVTLAGVSGVAAAPASASAPLGVILQATRPSTGVDIVNNGTTVYDGDMLQTNAQDTLRARLGGPELFLRPSTTAKVHRLMNGYSAELTRGTVVASSREGQTFQVFANGVTIRPKNSQPTVAQVTWVTPKELLLSSSRGVLIVSMGDQTRAIQEGQSYRMQVESDPGSQGGGGGPYHTGRNRFLLFLITGVAVGTGIGVWRALISPSNP